MENYLSTLKSILRQAGNMILDRRLHYADVTDKEKNEIVTPADIDANHFIIDQLSRLYPAIPIYSEEGNAHKSDKQTRWIVDPLDGTTPWVWGNSGFSVSVALEIDGEVAVGAVYDPVMKEFFHAEKGKGAFRNNQQIRVVKEVKVKDMFMVVDWGNKDEKRKEGLAYVKRFFLPEMFCRRIVPQWAPALGLCHIAEGRIHALICNDTWVEDHAAGVLIIQEAGGYATNFYHTDAFSHRECGIIAANGKTTHGGIVSFLKQKTHKE